MVRPEIEGFQLLRDRLNAMSSGGRKFKERFNKLLQKNWELAARAFVRQATRNVLVETGMSVASLSPLARAIGKQNLPLRRARKEGGRTRKGIPELPFGNRSKGRQGPNAGVARGRKPAFTYTPTTPNARNPQFRFEFQTPVYQFALHERRLNSNALLIGREAFIDVLESNIPVVLREAMDAYLSGKDLKVRDASPAFVRRSNRSP